jgi:hypothetical protein
MSDYDDPFDFDLAEDLDVIGAEYHAFRMVEATAESEYALWGDTYLTLRAEVADFDQDLVIDALVGYVGMLARIQGKYHEGGLDELLDIMDEGFNRDFGTS